MMTEQEVALQAIADIKQSLGAFLQQHELEFEEVTVNTNDLIPSYALDVTPLSDFEQRELLASIRTFGIISRVVINEKYEILDGANRVAFAKELGWDKIKVLMLKNSTPGLDIFIAYQLNYARRNSNAETRHKAFNAFKNKLLNLLEGKTREEAIAILPEIGKFWPEVKVNKRTPKKSEVEQTIDIVSGVPSSTLRKWKAADKIKKEMATVLPEQFPTAETITDSAALRFLQKKKKMKPGATLVDSALALCMECDKRFNCSILKAISNRSCYADANQEVCKNLKPLDKEAFPGKVFLQPSLALAEYYRSVKRIPIKDKAWKKVMLGRNIKVARQILEACDFNLDTAKFCVSHLGNHYDSKGLSWSLETILKNIDEGLREWKKSIG